MPTAGDNVKISYDASHPQARVVIDGVSQGVRLRLMKYLYIRFKLLLGKVNQMFGLEMGSKFHWLMEQNCDRTLTVKQTVFYHHVVAIQT